MNFIRIRGERDEEGEDEAGDDCDPDEVHTGSWASMGNEDGECAGTGIFAGRTYVERTSV
jgi:hypothetical protein